MDGVRKKSLKELLPKGDFEMVAKRPPLRRKKAEADELPEEDLPIPSYAEPPFRQPPRRRSGYLLWVLGIFILLVAGYYISGIFARATVKVTPKQQTTKMAGEFEANKAPAAGIEYSVIKLDESVDKTVPAGAEVKVENKAKGTATITNNFSLAAQPLSAGTRLSTASGLIYKLDSAVTVPGQKKVNGKLAPGSVAVKITAAEPGPAYNAPSADFKIVGFKGMSKYDKFSAKAGALTGGEQGLTRTVKDEDKQAAIEAAKKELNEKIAVKAKKQIPKDYVMFDDGQIVTYSDEQTASSASTTVTLRIRAEMVALLFNEQNLSENLAGHVLTDQAVDGVRIANLSALNFKLLGKNEFDLNKKTIDFSLAGDAVFVWPVDSAALKEKLAGTKLAKRNAVFSAFPNIARAQASILPPWILSFPAQADRISVKILAN